MTMQERIDRITRFDGDGLPVVSLYVGVEPDGSAENEGGARTRVNSLLDTVRAVDKDRSLDRDARLSVRGDLERLARARFEERWPPGMMALFSCSGRQFFEQVSLPRSIRDQVVVDGTPWTRPMLAAVEEYHRMGVVIADGATAQIWELYLRETRQVRHVRELTLRKPDYAEAPAERGVHNREQEVAKRHYRRLATILADAVRVEGFDLLAVGGHPHDVAAFADFLPRALRDRIAGTFTVDPGTATPAEVRRNAEAVLESYEREEERGLVAEIVEAVAERRWATLGVESCLWAGAVSAIQKLAVEEGPTAPGVVCDRDRWMALSGDTCPLCGHPTRATADVIDELVEAVIDGGGSVKHVRVGTDLHRYTLGARLRFPLPPQPAA